MNSSKKPTKVKLYSTRTCPYCLMEKTWLDSKKIQHDVVFVDLDPRQAQSMVEKTGQMGVPVIEIQFDDDTNLEYIIGFDVQRLSSILGVKK